MCCSPNHQQNSAKYKHLYLWLFKERILNIATMLGGDGDRSTKHTDALIHLHSCCHGQFYKNCNLGQEFKWMYRQCSRPDSKHLILKSSRFSLCLLSPLCDIEPWDGGAVKSHVWVSGTCSSLFVKTSSQKCSSPQQGDFQYWRSQPKTVF